MRIFRNKPFTRFARKERITDGALRDVVERAGRGLVDADLGSGIIKQRMARAGGGKSGGYRTIIVFRAGTRAFFVYGFSKNERDNIDEQRLNGLRLLATTLLSATDDDLAEAIYNGLLTEIISGD